MLEVIICIVLMLMFVTCFMFGISAYEDDETVKAIIFAVFAAIFLIAFTVALIYSLGLLPSIKISTAVMALIRISGLW